MVVVSQIRNEEEMDRERGREGKEEVEDKEKEGDR